MNGLTMKGTTIKGNHPGMSSLKTVPSSKNLKGQTHTVTSKKSSQGAGFGTSKKCGSLKGTTGR